jgi:hypothetical protein
VRQTGPRRLFSRGADARLLAPKEDLLGIAADYRAISPAELQRLERDPNASPYQAGGQTFSLEKEWHVFHFLFTGDPSLEPQPQMGPLGVVVFGGADTRFEASYGCVRKLEPHEVDAVAKALDALTVDELLRRIEVAAFNHHKIYPNPRPGGWDREEIEMSVRFYFPGLVEFFRGAADRGDVVLLSSD